MRVAVSIVCLAASACAWAPSPARLQPARVAALRMSDAAPESEPSAGSLEMLKFWEEWSEPRNKKEEYTRPVLIARFESLARENEALPAFMRFGGNTAYVEGWALYSETLGYEMGFFEDPWNRYGTLQDEQLRAMRLVVDTGLHAKGWSRERAIDFMLENSGMTRTEVVAEVERYIAIPSQALAYKVGALKIQELRQRAEEKLGDEFDIREFHAQMLDTGALPMPVLEAKIDRWIAATAD